MEKKVIFKTKKNEQKKEKKYGTAKDKTWRNIMDDGLFLCVRLGANFIRQEKKKHEKSQTRKYCKWVKWNSNNEKKKKIKN